MRIEDYKNSEGFWYYRPTINGKQYPTISCVVWENIQGRCREGGAEQKRYPRYRGCTNEFGNYQDFVNWHVGQVGYGRKWEIDKDLLVRGNLVYRQDTCILLHQELNSLTVKCNARRGNYPIGVCFDKRDKNFIPLAQLIQVLELG